MITMLDLIEQMTDKIVDETDFDEIEPFYFDAQFTRYESLSRELLLFEANTMGFDITKVEE